MQILGIVYILDHVLLTLTLIFKLEVLQTLPENTFIKLIILFLDLIGWGVL